MVRDVVFAALSLRVPLPTAQIHEKGGREVGGWGWGRGHNCPVSYNAALIGRTHTHREQRGVSRVDHRGNSRTRLRGAT